MNEVPFSYPSLFWALPTGLVFMVLGWLITQKVLGGLFMGVVGLAVSWLAHSALLAPQMEKWLEGQRAYAILFNDFPQDKKHFISEYVAAYQNGGQEAVAQKEVEMKIIMMEHHVKHYIDRAHTDTVRQYILAEAWLLSTLSKKDHNLCNHYLADSKYFPNVWRAVGSDIFLASLRYNPQMIVEAADSPEEVTPGDQAAAIALTTRMMKTLGTSGAFGNGVSLALPCDGEYQAYYTLAQMPPKDAVLILKLILSENHLKEPVEKSLLQKLLPF